MDSKTKLIFSAFILAVLSLGFVCYQKYVVDKDYSVYAEAPCDPLAESCFIYNCDPDTEECTGDPDDDITYYKQVVRMANRFPNCDPNNSEECSIAHCDEDESDCSVTLCDSGNSELTCSSVDDFSPKESTEESANEDDVDQNTEESADLEIVK